jgi:hypothetical protein
MTTYCLYVWNINPDTTMPMPFSNPPIRISARNPIEALRNVDLRKDAHWELYDGLDDGIKLPIATRNKPLPLAALDVASE